MHRLRLPVVLRGLLLLLLLLPRRQLAGQCIGRRVLLLVILPLLLLLLPLPLLLGFPLGLAYSCIPLRRLTYSCTSIHRELRAPACR